MFDAYNVRDILYAIVLALDTIAVAYVIYVVCKWLWNGEG